MTAEMILAIAQLTFLAIKEAPAVANAFSGLIDEVKTGKISPEEAKSRMETMVSQEYQLVDRNPSAPPGP